MEFRLDYIETKPNDFKICKSCSNLNWYENEDCCNCNFADFDELGEGVPEWVEAEHEYWVGEYPKESHRDEITYDCYSF